jgi:ubiquinone/menaquinone biosynthesis C-methylase UbiE
LWGGDLSAQPEAVKARTVGVFGRAAATYDTVIPFFEAFAGRLVVAAQVGVGERVLDVACGRGAVARVAAGAVGSSGCVVGVDLSEAMVEEAKKGLAQSGFGNVEVRVGDAERLDLPTGSFDVALCGFGVFFFPDARAALSGCHRVLRVGGRFGASTFAGSGGYGWERDVLRELGFDDPELTHPLRTADGVIAALRRAQFAGAVVTRVTERFVFPDLDSYVAWNWSHGSRRVLERMDENELERYRAAVAGRLADHAVEGGFELVQAVDSIVAQATTAS